MKKRKNTILIDWGISYALILLVPLITIFINYFHNTSIIKEEIMQAHELILENLKDNIDRVMEEEREMFTLFSTQQVFKDLVSASQKDAEFYENVKDFSKQLGAYGESNKGISYWLYMQDKDYITYNNSGDTSRNVYYSQRLLAEGEMDYEQWESLLNGKYTNDFFIFDGLYDTYGKSNLIYANSYSDNGKKWVNIFVSIPVSVIEDLTNSLPAGTMLTVYFGDERKRLEEQLLVVDSQGVMSFPDNVDIAPVIAGERSFEMAYYMGISATGDNGKVIYSLLVPQEAFWNELRYSRNMHLVGLLITLLVGIALMLFLLKRNFHPVSELLKFIGSDNKEMNEFQQIEAAYSMVRQEKSKMHNTIQTQEKSLLSSYLLSMFKGRVTGIGSREQESALELAFQSGSFAIVGFYIPPDSKKTAQSDELDFFVVNNIFSELMEEETFYHTEDGRFLYYLFCISAEQAERWKEKSLKAANFLCEFLDEKFELNLLAAVSAVEQGSGQIRYIYQSVMEAFEYKRVIGGSGVITTDELQGAEENEKLHDCHVMLRQALVNSNALEARRASKQLFLHTEHIPFIVLRIKVLEAFQIVVDQYNTCITNPSKQKQLLAWLDTLLNADNAEAMKIKFDEMLSFACDKISAQWEAENRGIVKNIREYVEANYTDSNLNVNSIAEKMNRNPVYISKIYKEDTGEGILDYLNALRIKKAQELLLEGGISVEEIGQMVGYASTRTFRRSFTKIVGMTPGSYCGGEADYF